MRLALSSSRTSGAHVSSRISPVARSQGATVVLLTVGTHSASIRSSRRLGLPIGHQRKKRAEWDERKALRAYR